MHLLNLRRVACGSLLWTALAGSLALTVQAEEYLGAEAVLRQALETNGPAKAKAETVSPQRQLQADLKAFQTNEVTLSDAEAASQWLKLLDRLAHLPADPMISFHSARNGEKAVQVEDVMAVLPPPRAWKELARQVEQRPAGTGSEARRQIGLRLLAHTLIGDQAGRREDMSALQALAAKAKVNQAYQFNSVYEQLNRTLLATLENPDAIIAVLERQLAAQQGKDDFSGSLEIPDLVALAGREKAEAFLRKALVQAKGDLDVPEGTATQKLAQQLALELVGKLKRPQWSLVDSLETVELYEAMEQRFAKAPAGPETGENNPELPPSLLPVMDSEDYNKQSARVYYFLGLIAKGRVTNAVAVAKQFEKEENVYFPSELIRQMERAGFTGELNDFLHEQLRQNPELPFWNEYVTVAAHAGKTAEMLELVRATLGQSNLSKGQRQALQQTLYEALLAHDDVEAGVAELRNLIQAPASAGGAGRNFSLEDRGELGLKLARIGRLLNQTNWVAEGLAVAKSNVLAEATPDRFGWGNRSLFSLTAFLQQNGRSAEAEQVLAVLLAREVKEARANQAARRPSNEQAPRILCELVRIYQAAGRPTDVLRLLDEAPFWGVKDLGKLSAGGGDAYTDYAYDFGKHVDTPVGFYAAAALAQTGRPAEARKLLDSLFDQSPGCDRLYELLLTLDEEHAPAVLDAIFARDPFEERPLIWKAHWLRLHQQLEAAEQAARKAISIDPTDGEEGPGDRLRAYAELAEIRAARGDQQEAGVLRGAVQAVQQAELADQFHAAGLLKRAIDLYTASLTQFADAYCIHARLAVQLSDMGKHEEAAEHYRRAYELMPDSFGRVESHCFGCERAFDGERAQGIAEKVFSQLAVKTPNKPQIHYLLGYLREEQLRYQEAMASYRTAVKLDPDYLNARVKMESVGEHICLPSAERDAIVFNILRLDPQHHRIMPSVNRVSDLAALWNQVAGLKQATPPEVLYPLAASAAELAKRPDGTADDRRGVISDVLPFDQAYDVETRQLTPARAVAHNGFIQAGVSLLRNYGDLSDDE